MEISELQQLTLDVLRDLYVRFKADLFDSQFLQDMNTGSIANKVAFRAYKAGLWKPPHPLAQENEIYAGDVFPREDVSTVRSVIWRYVGLGILTPRMMTVDDRNQFFEISHYGRRVLEEEGESPYDPLGFIQRLKTDSPNLQSNTIEYIGEAVSCYLGRYLRAATVMIGLASENEIIALLGKYERALDEDKKKEFQREIASCRNLKMRFDLLYNKLKNDKSQLPIETREIETWLNGVFQVIRLSRNDAGHPIGINPTNEDVFANIVLFRTYARYISKLAEYLDSKAKS